MGDLLDLVFPPHCSACGIFGDWVCGACFSRIEPAQSLVFEGLDGVFALGMYHDPIWRSVVHGLKYRGGTCLLPRIRALAGIRVKQEIIPWGMEEPVVFQHLPTDPLRERERGFDQAQEISHLLAPIFSSSAICIDMVERRREGQPAQASLEDPFLRQANVLGMYGLCPGREVPQGVVLVDDVVTTGASMAAVAGLLREAGVERVYGLALALGA